MTTERTITIFDTTLRDGEQSPGASMNNAEKLEIAQALVQLGVDVIEAGFPIASPGDFEAVRQIATSVRGATICGLARCNPDDIDRAWEALREAQRARIHVFLATSAIHREFKLKMGKDEIIQRAIAGGHCSLADRDGMIVGFGVMDHRFFDHGMVWLLYVGRGHRRQGVGSSLLEHFERGCETGKLFTSTNQSNRPMQALLGRRGYRLAGSVDYLDEGDPELIYVRLVRGAR